MGRRRSLEIRSLIRNLPRLDLTSPEEILSEIFVSMLGLRRQRANRLARIYVYIVERERANLKCRYNDIESSLRIPRPTLFRDLRLLIGLGLVTQRGLSYRSGLPVDQWVRRERAVWEEFWERIEKLAAKVTDRLTV